MKGFSVDQIDHVEVLVHDIDASIRWYADVLGLREYSRHEPGPVMIGAGNTKIALFKAAGDATPPMPTKPATPLRWLLVAWRTTREGFERAQRHLSAHGVAFHGPIDHDDSFSIYFNDLDGHPLEITYYLE